MTISIILNYSKEKQFHKQTVIPPQKKVIPKITSAPFPERVSVVLALLISTGKFLIVMSEKQHREDKNHNPELRLILDRRICEIKRDSQPSHRILSHGRTQRE
jgi:hypothetical protein